jgi:hypothetical protein
MYMIHEHSQYTSAMDKYWLFENKDDGWEMYLKMISNYSVDSLDKVIYQEIYELYCDDCEFANEQAMDFDEYLDNIIINPYYVTDFEDNDFIMFIEFDDNNFGRRG